MRLSDKTIKCLEVDLIRAALQHPGDDVLDHGLGHVHVTGQVAEGHLRLYHPELGGMALGIGVLGTEGGAEGIHIAEGHGKVLGVQLAGHRQAGFLTEEVLGVIKIVYNSNYLYKIISSNIRLCFGAILSMMKAAPPP